MAALLELDGVTTSLRIGGRSAVVLADVGLSVDGGEIVGLVGESGSGKSMTARTIIRLLPRGARTAGSVRLGGREIPQRGRALQMVRGREVAMIFQDPRAHIDPLYRAGVHLTEGLRAYRGLRGKTARDEALRLLASVGIADGERVFDAYPSQVSGGMLQRVLIAGALTGEPSVLIADEPTTALDVTTQAEIAALLDTIRREGRGILFITHDLGLAAAICDRILVMYAGRIVEEQRTADLFSRPLHPYTAGLLRARPRLDRRRGRIDAIEGVPVSAFDAPLGCPFAPRCAHAREQCTSQAPPLSAAGDGARGACLRTAEIRDLLASAVADG